MTEAEIAAELSDFIFHLLLETEPMKGTGMERLYSASVDIDVRLKNGANDLIQQLLRNFREGYPRLRSYINEWNPPAQSYRINRRPGWMKE
jgi:hypothetical protein